MYMGFTWPLVGGMAAARAGAPGRAALVAAIGAMVLPAGFVLGRELQRRRTGRERWAPAPGTGTPRLPVPRRPHPAPAASVGASLTDRPQQEIPR
ncbi:hypothetical protein [Streptomyces sp. NBC_00212]|uniref:hypothetical protein n=1 Tax=Streptomyces sp. NBC_00212 TaxID=2975684 RepID=UPI003246848E